MKKRKKPAMKRANREERLQKKKQTVVTYFIVLLMVASIAGFALSSNQMNSAQRIEYRGYEFEQLVIEHPLAQGYSLNGLAEVQTGAIFYSSPYQAEKIPTTGNVSKLLKTNPYFMYTFTPDTEFDTLHDWLRYELASRTTKTIIPGVMNKSTAYAQLPLLTCANATPTTPVLQVTIANTTAITASETGCIDIQTQVQDILLIRDRIFYSLSGIMNT